MSVGRARPVSVEARKPTSRLRSDCRQESALRSAELFRRNSGRNGVDCIRERAASCTSPALLALRGAGGRLDFLFAFCEKGSKEAISPRLSVSLPRVTGSGASSIEHATCMDLSLSSILCAPWSVLHRESGTGPVQSRHTNQCERAQYSVCVTSANLQHPENRHLRLLVDTVLGELHVLVVSAAGEVEAA